MKIFLRILLGLAALLALLLAGVAVVVATIDKRALLAPLTSQIEQATGRAVVIGGEPRIDVALTPTLVLEDVTLANAPWGSAKEMLRAKRIEVQVALLPLLSRRLDLTRLTLVEPVVLLETDRSGKTNWTFGGAAPAPAPATPASGAAAAFALGEFTVERGEVAYRDGRTGEVTPVRIERLYVRARDLAQPLVAQFKGRVGTVPVDVEGTLGPLGASLEGPWPVGLKGDVDGRATDVRAKVKAGPDAYEAQDLALAVGGTKLAGSLAWQARKDARPLLRFDLVAETLQPKDLALAAAATPARTAKPDAHLFPATPVSFDALRALDAQGRLRVATLVLDDGRKLGPMEARIAIDGARLSVDDLVLTAYGGVTRGRVVVDAREAVPSIVAKLDGRQLDGAALLAAAGPSRQVQGAKTDVALDVAMRGASPRAWAASLAGQATVKVGAGSFATSNEGLSPDLRAMLDALNPVRRTSSRTQLACAAARLPFRAGVARVERGIAFETDRIGVSASGTIDLASETLDLRFAPRLDAALPVDLARLAGAVRLQGPLRDPAVHVDPLGAMAAAADVRALVRGGATALFAARPAAGGGNECAVALGAAAPTRAEPAPAQRPATPDPVREAEKALRGLFKR